jgi:ribosome-associated toxin RatA of RatAB toxin-antitoxin module
MRTVRLRLHVPYQSASDVYATLANFERYPDLCEAVQKVTVTEVSENRTVSQWEVTFRAGLLRWTEEDTFDPGALSITFCQLEGDIAVFDGSWQCADAAHGSEIIFSARLDMGIPSLADALEPIAARTLTGNIVSIVRGLTGSAELVASEVAVPAGSAP